MDNIVDELIIVSGQLKRAYTEHFNSSFEERTASMLQLEALRFLKKEQGAKVTEVAQYLQLSISSATQLIERLSKSSYIKRTHDNDDRRVVRISITQAGKEQLQELQNVMHQKMKGIFAHLPQKDLEEFLRIQQDLLQALKNN